MERLLVHNELEMVCRELIVAYFKVLC